MYGLSMGTVVVVGIHIYSSSGSSRIYLLPLVAVRVRCTRLQDQSNASDTIITLC